MNSSKERFAMTINDPVLAKVFEREGPHKQAEFQQKYIDILAHESSKKNFKQSSNLETRPGEDRLSHYQQYSEGKRSAEKDFHSLNDDSSMATLEKRVEALKNRLVSAESTSSKLLSKIESDDINMIKSEQKLVKTIQTVNNNLLETKSYAAKIEENKKFLQTSFENIKILKKLAAENDKLRTQLKEMTEKFQQISTNNNQQYLLSKIIQLENEIKIKEERNRQLEESLKGMKNSPAQNGSQLKEVTDEMNMLRIINENLNNKIEKQNSVIRELQKIIEYHENQKNVSIGNVSASNIQANTSLVHANKLPTRSPKKSILD